VVWQFFRHGIEVLVYVVFVSVIGLAIERLVARPLPAQLGGDHPFAHVLMMGACCLAAVALLRHVRRDFDDRPQRGMLGRSADVALGMGMQAAVGGVGGAAAAGVKGLRSRWGRESRPPWEQLESTVGPDNAAHGEPRRGFDPVPGPSSGGAPESGREREGDSVGVMSGGTSAIRTQAQSAEANAAAVAVSSGLIPPITASVGPPVSGGRGVGGRILEALPAVVVGQQNSSKSVPISRSSKMASMDRTPGSAITIPPISWATTGYGEDIPPNLDPPEDEDAAGAADSTSL
jgi:hypothetical protein